MAGEESNSLFFPLPNEEPKAEPSLSQAQTEQQPSASDSGSLFVPLDQFEGRLQNVSDPEDQRKAAISGIYEGVTRLPSAASGLIRSGIDEVQYLDLKRQEKAGKIPSADEAFADYKLAQEQASEQSFLKKIPEAAEKYLPSYGYEPKTYAGALSKEAVTSGIESTVYPFLGAGGAMTRFGVGALSGALGEGMRQKFEGTPYEPYAQFAGAFGGQILGDIGLGATAQFAKGYKLWGAEKELNEALTDALQSDIKNNMTKISPDELQTKLKSGEPINLGEVLAPESKTLSVLQDLAANVPGKKSNEMVSQKLGELSTSKILNGGELNSALKAASDDESKRVFDILRANPDANNIMPNAVGKIIENPVVKKSMERVANATKNVDQAPGFEIIPPSYFNGKTEVFTYGPAGSVNGGNLNYWHAVKKDIDDLYEKTGNPLFLDVKRQLISGIDNAIGGETKAYSGALAESAAKYGDLSAMQNGYRLMGDLNALKIEDILSKTKGMNETQLANLRDGAIARLNEVASEPNGVQKLYNGIISGDSKLSQKMKAIFGDDYNQVTGSIIQQSMLNKAATTSERLMKIGEKVLEQKGYALGAASGISALAGYMAGADVSTNSALVGLGMLLGGRQLAMNTLEKKVAPLALEAIRNPDGGRKLLELMEKNPQARTLIEKISAGLTRATLAGARSSELSEQESPEPLQSLGMPSPNAHGGRIAYKSGGRVKNARAVAESLLREIDQTRKMIGKKTEDILSMPDDAVATALTIARGNV